MDSNGKSKEERILAAVKFVLVSVAKETATAPGMQHPLSDATLHDIRQCLTLIADRERELQAERGEESTLRPVTAADKKPAGGEVKIPLDSLRKPRA